MQQAMSSSSETLQLNTKNYIKHQKQHSAMVFYDRRRFTTRQMSLTMFAKEFLAIFFACDQFGHILWGVYKYLIVLTDNKALIPFFEAEQFSSNSGTFCDQAIQFNFKLAHEPFIENPAADYLSHLDRSPTDKLYLELTDSGPIHRIQMDVASKTPKRDENEEGFNSVEVTQPDRTMPTSLSGEQIDVTLTMVTRRNRKTDDDYRCRHAFVKQQLEHHGTGTSSKTDHFKQFVAKCSCYHPVKNQVSTRKESTVILAQFQDSNFQRKVPSNNVNFESIFFQKVFKEQNGLKEFHDILYRKCFDHKGKVTSKQIVVSDDIVDDIIRTLHDNPMQRHPGLSEMLHEICKRFYTPNITPEFQS